MLHELMGKKFYRSNFSLWLFIKLAHFIKQMSACPEDGLHIYNNVKHKRLLLQAQKSVYFERMFCCTFGEQLEKDYYL